MGKSSKKKEDDDLRSSGVPKPLNGYAVYFPRTALRTRGCDNFTFTAEHNWYGRTRMWNLDSYRQPTNCPPYTHWFNLVDYQDPEPERKQPGPDLTAHHRPGNRPNHPVLKASWDLVLTSHSMTGILITCSLPVPWFLTAQEFSSPQTTEDITCLRTSLPFDTHFSLWNENRNFRLKSVI